MNDTWLDEKWKQKDENIEKESHRKQKRRISIKVLWRKIGGFFWPKCVAKEFLSRVKEVRFPKTNLVSVIMNITVDLQNLFN